MTEPNALTGVVDLALEVLAPLEEAAADQQVLVALLGDMGWSARGVDPVGLGAAVDALTDAVEALRAALAFTSLADLVETLGSLATIPGRLGAFADAFVAATGTDPDAVGEVVGALAVDLLEHLTLRWLGTHHPGVSATLALLGVVDRRAPTTLSTGGQDPLLARGNHPRPTLALDVLGALVRDPVGHVRARLGVRVPDSDAIAEQVVLDVLSPLLDLVIAAGGDGVVGIGGTEPEQPDAEDAALRRRATFTLPLPSVPADTPPTVAWFVVGIEVVATGSTSRGGDAGPGVLLTPHGDLRVEARLPDGELTLRIAGGAELYLPANGSPTVRGGSGLTAAISYRTVPAVPGAPAVVVGADTAHLSLGTLTAGLTGRAGRADAPQLNVTIDAGVEKAEFVLAPGEGDGFLSSVLPADGVRFAFDLGLAWSNRRGLSFRGAAGLEAELGLHVDLLGVLRIDVLHLALKAGGADGAVLDLAVGADATLTLGPLTASVQWLGLAAALTAPAGGGSLGPLDVRPRFLPPRGVALALDTATVTGGGFVRNDPDQGRYAGILALDVVDVVAVTAIGLISTRMPDGSEGFSLLIILTATFAPIQLGYGFTLSGLGGILGLHRTMNLPALRDGARSGVLDSILFPVDPVRRAAKVISDVESVFPVAPGRFVIGLMARLGWGTPQLVTVDLGVVVEIPAPVRIALLGRVAVVLPTAKAAVVKLHLDIVGTLDLGRGELSVDATLHDSRVAVFDVYGDMAVRVGWGATPAFVVSVGGLNPRYAAPPGLPDLRRLTVALATGKNPRVRLEAYLAVTSNSVQAGARLDAHAELDAGFVGLFSADVHLGFDALVLLDPFRFIVDFGGGITIKRNRKPFLGADLALTLDGPQPLRVTGHVKVHFFGTHRIPISVRVGHEPRRPAIAARDPLPDLLAALGNPASWTARPPARATVVVVREPAEGALLRAHPFGALGVRQRVVPLDVRITRFGGAPLAGGPRRFTVTHAVGGAPASPGTPVREAWAPGELFDLTDDEKLSRPAFEHLVAGSDGLGAPATTTGTVVAGALPGFETGVVDVEDPVPHRLPFYVVPAGVLAVLRAAAAGAAAARVPGYVGPDLSVRVAQPAYAVASVDTLEAASGREPSHVEALETLGGLGTASAGLAVVRDHEAVRP